MWQNIPMPYWFDGNNLIGQSAAASRSDPRRRREFLSVLSTYHKTGGGRFLVYFDGDDPDGSMPPPGIGVRYSAPLSTDEAMIRRLKEIRYPGEIIVVSNDHDLMNRCRNAGATTLNWREFMSKMKSRPIPEGTEHETQQTVDVEDWIKYFGLDKKEI